MPIPFEELAGSPRLRVTDEATIAQRVFRVAWADWPAFVGELVGGYALVGGAFVFTLPIEFPDLPNLVVAEIDVEPFVPDRPIGDEVSTLTSGVNRYPDAGAQVTATYRTQFDAQQQARTDLPAVPAGTYLTYTSELGLDRQVVPGRTWHWVNPPTNPLVPPDINPALLVPTGDFRLSWRRVAAPPWSTIRDLRGKVNHATFLGSPAGTVLFLGATVTRNFHYSATGGFWTVDYSFAERTVALSTGVKVGWNHFYKEQPLAGEHWVAIADDSGNAPYRSGDFSPLFQFGT